MHHPTCKKVAPSPARITATSQEVQENCAAIRGVERSERLGAPQLADHRPLLATAGFDVEIYEEPPNWQRQQRALQEGIIASESKLAEEMEVTVAASYVAMARGALADMPV